MRYVIAVVTGLGFVTVSHLFINLYDNLKSMYNQTATGAGAVHYYWHSPVVWVLTIVAFGVGVVTSLRVCR